MEKISVKVALITRKQSTMTPEAQIRKFNETMEGGSFERVESRADSADSAAGASRWQREFRAGKKPKQMIKATRNLLERAGEYSDVLRLEAEIIPEGDSGETFTWGSAQSSEYFKTRSWK